MPQAQAAAINVARALTGPASGIVVFLPFFGSAATSQLVGYLHDGTFVPLVAVTFGTSVLAVLSGVYANNQPPRLAQAGLPIGEAHHLHLGAGQIRTFFEIVVPLARPGIVSGIILVFIPALGTFLISDLLGGPDSQLIGNVIERQFKGANDWPLGAAMSFILMYLAFAILALRAVLAQRHL